MKQFVCILAFLVCSISAAHEVCWRDYVDARIPNDAYAASIGLYIGQIPSEGLIPATIYSGKKEATGVSPQGKYVETAQGVKILCTNQEDKFSWRQITAGSSVDLNKAVRGGSENGNTVYIGKSFHENQWKIGKYVPASRQLHLWSGKQGVTTVSEFELLEVN